MERRNFFKLLGGTAAALLVPEPWTPGKTYFLPLGKRWKAHWGQKLVWVTTRVDEVEKKVSLKLMPQDEADAFWGAEPHVQLPYNIYLCKPGYFCTFYNKEDGTIGWGPVNALSWKPPGWEDVRRVTEVPNAILPPREGLRALGPGRPDLHCYGPSMPHVECPPLGVVPPPSAEGGFPSET